MFACPNCGGNLKFHIPTQKLLCEFCNTEHDPYAFDSKDKDAEEQHVFEATIFTCPQCGGEILSTDNAAAGFCSFCGASTVLFSRISKENRPNYIIPFQKTKEDCKRSYADLMRHAIFAPKALKDPSFIDGFRGIYMPYWAFYLTQQGPMALPAEKSYRRGDYIITDHYMLEGDLDCYYKGLSYDASSSFEDDISEAIAPYDVKGMKAFTPAFFSGFYADTSDVPADVYHNDARTEAMKETFDKISKDVSFKGYSIKKTPVSYREEDTVLHTQTKTIDSAMFPVWFMSYRNGDRVSYATVNGQTGKVVADLPVAIPKYLLGSFLIAIPIFILLNLFLTLMPSTVLTASAFFSIVTTFIFLFEIKAIVAQESKESDKGFLYRNDPAKFSRVQAKENEENQKELLKKSKKSGSAASKIIKLGIPVYMIGFAASFFLQISSVISGEATDISGMSILWMIIPLVALISGTICLIQSQKIPDGHRRMAGICLTLLSVICGAVIMFLKPVADISYYIAVILLLFSICLLLTDMISYYNLLSTRRLPQFDKQGGDDRA